MNGNRTYGWLEMANQNPINPILDSSHSIFFYTLGISNSLIHPTFNNLNNSNFSKFIFPSLSFNVTVLSENKNKWR